MKGPGRGPPGGRRERRAALAFLLPHLPPDEQALVRSGELTVSVAAVFVGGQCAAALSGMDAYCGRLVQSGSGTPAGRGRRCVPACPSSRTDGPVDRCVPDDVRWKAVWSRGRHGCARRVAGRGRRWLHRGRGLRRLRCFGEQRRRRGVRRLDNDCDGEIDEEVTDTFYGDADGDGYGDPESIVDACSPPEGTVTSATDCDDAIRTSTRLHETSAMAWTTTATARSTKKIRSRGTGTTMATLRGLDRFGRRLRQARATPLSLATATIPMPRCIPMPRRSATRLTMTAMESSMKTCSPSTTSTVMAMATAVSTRPRSRARPFRLRGQCR